jgi:hypothetical protein
MKKRNKRYYRLRKGKDGFLEPVLGKARKEIENCIWDYDA